MRSARSERIVTSEDLESLAVGAWILGTGGGGNPYPGLLNMRGFYARGGEVRLVDVADLDDDAAIATVASQGAPLVGQERLKDPEVISRSVHAMEEHLGHGFSALMSLEVGGGNAFYPLMAAAHLGYPVVDADWMGRAYPELQMTGLGVGDLKPFPLATVDPRGSEAIVTRARSWKALEDISRRICTEYGSTASICLPPVTGGDVRRWAVLNTISRAIAIGAAVRRARSEHGDTVEALLAVETGKLLFRGKVTDVARQPTNGFLRGLARFQGSGDWASSDLEIAFQNEWIVAWRDGEPIAMTPDLICVLDSVSGEAFGTETLRYGQRADILALSPPSVFLTEKGLDLVGPRAFGYDLPFKSVFAS